MLHYLWRPPTLSQEAKMRRIGEVIVTVAVMTMVASLTVADQIRRKASAHKRSTEVLADDEEQTAESKSHSRADSIILHLL